MFEKPGNLFKIMRKYLKRDVAIPDLVLTRVQKREEMEWEDYYQDFDQSFKELYENTPKKTAIFLNCQVNPNVSVLVAGQELKLSSNIKNTCYVLDI